jgi:hypothetical protein
MSDLFRVVDVWRRLDGRAVRYRCFHVIPSDQFCVQSADFYSSPADLKQSEHLDRQFVELFLTQAPDERSKTFPSLEEAIAHHDLEFSDN